jgi:peptidoglycan/xylan/chitin deacetylase (PgdA/CDA1 family)
MSVDMDEWYQCRWATGSEGALWPDTATCFREYYGSDSPGGEMLPLAEKILDLFAENDIRATFFFTGEVAGYYPELVRQIAAAGHEIGSHNLVHKDYNADNREEFRVNLAESKQVLEDVSGQTVIGYRAPNSTVESYMIGDLIECGFRYDSSVTPTRPLMGKFGKFQNAPHNPYQLSRDDLAVRGDSGLWEFPWPVFPWGRLPAGSGITSRIAGYRYTVSALDAALKTGDSVYYFHPYEIGSRPKIRMNAKIRLFLRNLGPRYFKMLVRLIERYRGRFVTGRELLEKHTSGA